MLRKLKLIVLLNLVCISAALAQTTEFTYQGKLFDGALPPTANYDLEFRLFDAMSGGTPQGATVTRLNVAVASGIFTVQLDFGNQFTGANRFLDISVRPAGGGAFTQLTPRQPITSSPYSIQSLTSTSANGLSVSCVSCVTDFHIQSLDGAKVTGTVANATNATNAATAGNVTGIVAIANGGTGSSTQSFIDLSTNQTNIGGDKTFTGIVSGNGAGLHNVPGTVKWQTVAGSTQQALPNNGYLATNSSQVTVTLPTTPNIGDIVRVSGIGLGGWKIAQNAGQTIIGANIGVTAVNWTPRESFRQWRAVASSADGSKLVAVVVGGQIYTSTDSGVTWIPRESNRNWNSVASSVDGSKLVAVVVGGQIYTSTDSGVTWTPGESNRNWYSVASSADGNKLVAVVYPGQIYTSTDSGVTWTPKESSRSWISVASSADGNKLVAATDNAQIYTSTDSGISWTPRDSGRTWQSVASSADGSKLVAVVYNGQIYTSIDSGMNWTPGESNRIWYSAASSADGSRLAALVIGGQIYTSTDSGATWTPGESNRDWRAIASSADGSKLVAVSNGQIYTALAYQTTIGTAGFITGGQNTSIELQYIGNGQFLPLSFVGVISGN